MVIGYAISLALAVGLLISYFCIIRKKDFWLGLLFLCVTVVNLGYFMLSLSKTVEFALFSNSVAYLGSVFLCLCMFFSILRLCGFYAERWLVITCVILGVGMFAIIATAGILPWYYKDVWLETIDGGTKLHKEYGVLHPLYLVYLLGYFAAMIVAIILSIKKKKVGSPKFASLLAGVVCGNILVWLFEKFISWEFEFLALTYIASEIVLLLVYWMMQDYILVRDIPKFATKEQTRLGVDIATMPKEIKIGKVLAQLKDGEILAHREREVLECILENKKRKEIADSLHLSENTIKTYTRSLYLKLGVGSREELYALLLQD